MTAPARAAPLPLRPGLSSLEARLRLAEQGPNVIAEQAGPSRLREFLANLAQLFALLLWAGAALALIAGMPELTAAIVTVILVNAVFSYVQEHRAEQAVAALRDMLPVLVRVRRDGRTVEIQAEDVVSGDLLLLAPGDRVSADGDLLSVADLRVDESTLTGESVPAEPTDRVFAGTYVIAGTAEVRVTETAMATRLGRVAGLTQQTRRERSPLEHELDRMTRLVALMAVGIGTVFFLIAGLAGMGLSDRFVFAIGVMVALVPEGLLPTVTLSLALATQRMAGRNALVRRLSAVETLGETTVICTDKTGTLTENEMTAQRLWAPDGTTVVIEGAGYEPFGRYTVDGQAVEPTPFAPLLRAGLLCNDARLIHAPDGWTALGDPTEAALVVLAEKGGLRHEQEAALAPRLHELPFSSERKRMTTVHVGSGGSRVAYTKGAVEAVLPLTRMTDEEQALVHRAAGLMERDALRVLAVARRVLPAEAGVHTRAEELEQGLEVLGLIGMIDPPRPEVPEAVRRCQAAGIRILMITGDSGVTAEAIAQRVGLLRGPAHVITGAELDELDDGELGRRLAEHEVLFARVAPEQKLRLAEHLRSSGEVVAMTGDGVNDAPALKHADIGVAMGRGGTEVAKEAADLILLDDNFASVVAAVEEGRAVYENIRRFAGYHFCSNVGELVPFLLWSISGGAIPLPLVVMQVLAIDLGTDMVPAIALGTERAEPGTMDRPPRPRTERLLSRPVLRRAFGWIGPLEALAGMACFLFVFFLDGWRPGDPLPDEGTVYLQATTMTMAGIIMGQVGAGLSWRTNRLSLLTIGPFSNRLLLVGIAGEIALIALLSYTPGLDRAFHTSGLEVWHWMFLLIWPPVVLAAEEARKAVLRSRKPALDGARRPRISPDGRASPGS